MIPENRFGLELIAAVKKSSDKLKNASKAEVIEFLERAGVIQRPHKVSKIELCDSCKGEGIVYWDELVNYHKSEYDTHSKTCTTCTGSGRVIYTQETSTSREPFISGN